jgi:hypothetical protein
VKRKKEEADEEGTALTASVGGVTLHMHLPPH